MGSAATYSAAEKQCNSYAFDYYSDNNTPETAAAIVMADAPAIEVRPHVCDDTVDTKRLGTVIWNDYVCGEGDAEAEIYITESAIDNRSDTPALYVFGLEAIPLDLVDRVLPNIVALMNDPRVKAARAAWEAQRLAAGMSLTAPHAWKPPSEMDAWIQGIRDGKRWEREGKLVLG